HLREVRADHFRRNPRYRFLHVPLCDYGKITDRIPDIECLDTSRRPFDFRPMRIRNHEQAVASLWNPVVVGPQDPAFESVLEFLEDLLDFGDYRFAKE